MKNNHLIRALSIKPFFFLWLAEIFSQLAFNMGNFILIIVAYKLANTNAAVSGIVLAFTIPAIIFGLIAGVYVDRWNKVRVLFMTNILRAAFLFALAFLHTNLVVVYVLAFLTSVVTQFFIPAESPMIPLLVKKDLLVPANALFGVGIFSSILIGYALSGPFLLFFGQTYTFFALGVFFLVAAACISLIRFIPKKVAVKASDSENQLTVQREIHHALSLILKTRAIYHSLFLLALTQMVILILAVIGPGYANKIVGISVDSFPLYFVTPAALGMITGAFLVGHFLKINGWKHVIKLGLYLSGVAILLLPYGSKVASKEIVQTINMYLPHILSINILHIMIVLIFILGFANALVFVPSNTLLQQETSDAFRGKIYGSLSALVGVVSLLPVALVGELADILGVAKVLTGVGIVIVGIGILHNIFD